MKMLMNWLKNIVINNNFKVENTVKWATKLVFNRLILDIIKLNLKKIKKILLILIFIIVGCKDKEPEKAVPIKPITTVVVKNPYEDADFDLDKNSEKIMLLSILKKIPQDTLRLILRDYIKENPSRLYDYYDAVDVVDNLDTISQKYHISKNKIASLVFSYRYEMLTKDEIGGSAIENEQDNN